jgi:hypothetical protein
MLRTALAWALYGLGDLIWRVFDQILPFGMRGPIYGLYQWAMGASSSLQGDGPGPWTET